MLQQSKFKHTWQSREHGLLHERSLLRLAHHEIQILHCLPSSPLEQIIQHCSNMSMSEVKTLTLLASVSVCDYSSYIGA